MKGQLGDAVMECFLMYCKLQVMDTSTYEMKHTFH